LFAFIRAVSVKTQTKGIYAEKRAELGYATQRSDVPYSLLSKSWGIKITRESRLPWMACVILHWKVNAIHVPSGTPKARATVYLPMTRARALPRFSEGGTKAGAVIEAAGTNK
jgi:hypothetical protein